MPEKPKVFLSYDKRDVQIVRELYQFLLIYGCEPWMAEATSSQRQDSGNLTDRAIEDSDFFIACLSTNSVSNIYVQKEFRKALEVFHRVPEGHFFAIPIRLDECEIPHIFQNSTFLDWFNIGERAKLLTFLEINSYKQISLKLNAEYPLPSQIRRSRINIVKFAPDGKSLMAGLNQDRVAIWDTSSGELKNIAFSKSSTRQMDNLNDWPTWSIAISSNGKFLASTTYEREIQIWHLKDLERYKLIETFNHRATSLAFSPNNEWLVAGLDNDGEIWSWALNDGFRTVDHVRGHSDRIEALTFHPNQPKFVSCSVDGNIKFWEIVEEEIKIIHSYSGHDQKHIADVAFSPNGLLLASCSVNGQICLWNVETGQLEREWKQDDVVRTLAFSPDGSILVSCCNDRTLKVWNVANGSKLISKKFEHPPCTVDFSPDGQLLAIAIEASQKIEIWEVNRE